MKILLTGICGFVGSRLALRFAETMRPAAIAGIDNLSRPGAETNLGALREAGIDVRRGDVRLASDVDALPEADWVIDCAANPSVLAGVAPGCTPAQLVEHNLTGTLNVLEYCRKRGAGLVLLSTSRVYSVDALLRLPLRETATRFELQQPVPEGFPGVSERGITEEFPVTPPVSLYGATKQSSEIMALEYAAAFKFPVWINRCGVIGGPVQFGRIDQGIFSFWVYSCALGRPLKYIGFGGEGKQVRDCVSPEDVAVLVERQMKDPGRNVARVVNVGGGAAGAMSLRELTAACEEYFGRKIPVAKGVENRPYDIPYYVTDNGRVKAAWHWEPSSTARDIVLKLCQWTAAHMDLVKTFFA